MKKIITGFIGIMFLLGACTHSPEETLNSVISKSRAEKDITVLKKNMKLDSTKIRSLDNLLRLSKGHEFYANDLKTRKIIAVKFLVNDIKFEQITDSIFDYFKDQKVTYRKLLKDIDALNTINKKYSTLTNASPELRQNEIKASSHDWFTFNRYSIELFDIPKIN